MTETVFPSFTTYAEKVNVVHQVGKNKKDRMVFTAQMQSMGDTGYLVHISNTNRGGAYFGFDTTEESVKKLCADIRSAADALEKDLIAKVKENNAEVEAFIKTHFAKKG